MFAPSVKPSRRPVTLVRALDDDALSIPGFDFEPPPADEPGPEAPADDGVDTAELPRPINWNLLTAQEEAQ